MMDFDYRAKRLESEHKKMKEEAKRKLQQEKLLLEKKQERDKELAEYRQKQEEMKEKLRIEQEMIELYENQLTNGIHYQKQFQHFYEINSHENEIGDKIILSEDCLMELTNLDVFQKDSAVNFQLEITYRLLNEKMHSIHPTAETRKMITYCGINEFTAPKETIGLPPKIIDTIKYHSSFTAEESKQLYHNPFIPPFQVTAPTSLPATSSKPSSATPSPSGNLLVNTNIQILSVDLKYLKLPKCTYIKLKPKFHDFYHIEAIKRCLEDNLSFHTSITLNDVLLIKYRGEEFPLLVTDVKPERYGSLLNTDVEVDFDYSEEFEKQQQKQKEEGKVAEKSAAPIIAPILANSVGQKLGGNTALPISHPMDMISSHHEEVLAIIASRAANEEPIITAENKNHYLQAKFKLLNGKSLVRKFLFDQTLVDIFAYLVKELRNQNSLTDSEIPSLQLSVSNPTRTFLISDISNLLKTIAELELNVKNMLFFVSMH